MVHSQSGLILVRNQKLILELCISTFSPTVDLRDLTIIQEMYELNEGQSTIYLLANIKSEKIWLHSMIAKGKNQEKAI